MLVEVMKSVRTTKVLLKKKLNAYNGSDFNGTCAIGTHMRPLLPSAIYAIDIALKFIVSVVNHYILPVVDTSL